MQPLREMDRCTSGPAEQGSLRILLAEDDPAMRALVSGALRVDGHEVTELPDGGRLLVWIARCCRGEVPLPDLIVSDVQMPVMTGAAMLKGLRDARLLLPVVLMTAFPDTHTRWQAESFDAALIAKPFRMEELREVIRRELSPQRSEGKR